MAETAETGIAVAEGGAESEELGGALGHDLGVGVHEQKKGWFSKLMAWQLDRYEQRRAQGKGIARDEPGVPETDRALAAIRRACIKSAFSGAASGSLTKIGRAHV